MGCCSSGDRSGGKGDEPAGKIDVEFKTTKISSADKFFEECKQVLDSFNSTSAPLEESRKAFMEATGFDKEKKAKLSQAFVGMFTAFVSSLGGDPTDIKLDFVPESPFVKIILPPPLAHMQTMVETFEKYMTNVDDTIRNKLPDVVKQADDLPPAFDKVRDVAKPEIEGLGLMDKGKAIAAMAKNAKELAKMPTGIKNAAEALKLELEDA